MSEVCQECGSVVDPSEDFCGDCGTYLNWEERRAREPEPEPAVAEPEPTAEPTLGERVKAAVGLGGPEQEQAAGPPGAGEETTPGGPSGSDTRDDTAPEVAPVRPGAAPPRPKPARPTPAKERINPGDRICGSCGAGNDPSRSFCRRCGNDVRQAEVARVPWWRRLVGPATKPGLAAGSRPTVRRPRRWVRRVVTALVLVVILGVVFLAVVPYRFSAWERVLDRVMGTTQVVPRAATDPVGARPGHPAGHAVDGKSNTYWAPRGPGDGASLFVRLRRPVRLVAMEVSVGTSQVDQEEFQRLGSPRELDVVLFSRGGGRTVRTYELDATLGPQELTVGVSDVRRLRLTIDGVDRANDRDGVAIAAIDFFQRK